MNTENIKWNEMGFGFRPDESLTSWAHRNLNFQDPGLSKDYIILNVFAKSPDGEVKHIENLLFDTKTQEPVCELGLGSVEELAVRLDRMKIINSFH